jgi:hypothetical protein
VAATKKPPFSWDKSHFPKLQKEVPSLEIQPSEEMLRYLEQCFVAETHLYIEASVLQQMMVMEGIHRVKVTTMGDKKMLLFFEGGRDLEAV